VPGLDRRKEMLLRQVVRAYVRSAEPVGSHYLASRGRYRVRSATIRSELATMTRWGYLSQPHPSAGRLPSTLGFRYFVDQLMPAATFAASQRAVIDSVQELSEGDLGQLLQQTCAALASLTRLTGLAAPPRGPEPRLQQVHVVQVSANRLLVLIVRETGEAVHRFLRLADTMSPAEVSRLGRAAHALLSGADESSEIFAAPPRLPEVNDAALAEVIGVCRPVLQDDNEALYLRGAGGLLAEPEFRHGERTASLVRFLEDRRSLYEALQRLVRQQQLIVAIGDENPREEMRDLGVVVAPYEAGPGLTGWIGVLGPERMAYDRAVPAVRYTAQALTETLGRWRS